MSLLLSLALLLSPVFAQEAGNVEVGCFHGANDTDSPATLGPCAAQDALNVEANLDGTAIKKRLGYTREASLTYTTSPVNGSFRFTCDNGDAVSVVCHDRVCSKSVNGAAFSNFVTTAPASIKRWSFVSVNGDLYGANDQRSAVFKWDCTSLSHPPGIPAGSLLELSEDRLIVADTSANPNRIHYSKSGDFTNFTTGLESVDAYTDDLGAPGERTTGLKYHEGNLYRWSQRSITACELGDQYTSRCAILSNVLGTADPAAIVSSPSGLYFKSQDGSFWRFGDRDPISRKISTLVKSQPQGSGQNNTQTTQSDWEAGTQSPPGSWDTETTAGSVFPSSVTLVETSSVQFAAGTLTDTTLGLWTHSITLDLSTTATKLWDDFQDDDVTNNPPWTVEGSWTVATYQGSKRVKVTSCPSDVCSMTTPSTATYGQWAVDFTPANATFAGDTNTFYYYFIAGYSDEWSIRVIADAGAGAGNWFLKLYKNSTSVASYQFAQAADSTKTFKITRTSTGTVNVHIDSTLAISTNTSGTYTSSVIRLSLRVDNYYLDNVSIPKYKASGTFESQVMNTGFAAPIGGTLSVSSSIPTGTTLTYQVRSATSSSGDWDAYATFTQGQRISANRQYWQEKITFATTVDTSTPRVDDYSLPAATTGQFTAQCIQPGSAISSWGIISCDQTTSGNGSISIAITTGTDCTTISTGVYTTQTNNTNVSIAVGAAAKIRFTSLLTSATEQAQVNSCTLYWTNGVAVPPSWGMYNPITNAIYWAITTGNETANNRVLKYDLNLGGEWFPFDLPASAMSLIDNRHYFGSSTGGYWNKYGETGQTTDNGSAINAYWKSRDFSGGKPFQEKKWDRLSILARNQGSGSLTAVWANSNNVSDSYSISLSTSGSNYIRSNYNLPLMSPSSFMNVQVGNNAASQPFEVLGIRLDFTAQPWRVLTR